MRYARVKAANLRLGDVINGQRIRTTPFVHKSKGGDTVHFFLSNHGRVEPAKLGVDDNVTVKRPLYNLTRKPKPKLRAKDGQLVAEAIAPVQTELPPVEAAVQRAEILAGCN